VARNSTLNISIKSEQARLLRAKVRSGEFASPSAAIQQGLEMLFNRSERTARSRKSSDQKLAAAYRAAARHDRELAQDWTQLNDAWPDE
jgi:Arc/MetJ-type ribon-helix-helix transcriptional regulator